MSQSIWRPIDYDSLSQESTTSQRRTKQVLNIEPIVISDDEETTSSSSSLKSGKFFNTNIFKIRGK